MASIYSISAPCRLAWPRYTVYQPRAGLHGIDIQYISPMQACMAPIYSISVRRRLAKPRYTVYQSRAGMHGLDIPYISSAQACMTPIYRKSASNGRSSRILRGAVSRGGGKEDCAQAYIFGHTSIIDKKQRHEQFDLPIPEPGK